MIPSIAQWDRWSKRGRQQIQQDRDQSLQMPPSTLLYSHDWSFMLANFMSRIRIDALHVDVNNVLPPNGNGTQILVYLTELNKVFLV